MANITVVTTSTLISVDYGVYESDPKINTKGYVHLKRDRLVSVNVDNAETYVKVVFDGDMRNSYLHYTTNPDGYLIVDSIDGVAPTSLQDLRDKISALII